MADFLVKQGTMSARKKCLREPPEQLEDTLLRPIKMLRGMVQGSAMVEQIQSVVMHCDSMEEKVATAYQMAREWEPAVPDCILHRYENVQ